MKIHRKIFIGLFAGLLLPNIMPAQELPVIDAEESVFSGSLPNGMTYYAVSNNAEKGMADFCLVSKCDGRIIDRRDVMISVSSSVMDSTLLQIMNIADEGSPSDQAVIVSGDIDVASVAEKIKMLSYMIPIRDTMSRDMYEWKPGEGPDVRILSDMHSNLTVLTAKWKAPRTAFHMMNTIQPEISSLFTCQLGEIACERISMCLRQAEIPASGISYLYRNSAKTPGDEEFGVTVSVAPEDMEKAVCIISYVMASIDSGSVTEQEMRRSNAAYMEGLYRKASCPMKFNSEYVDRCISSFLYNSSLASSRAVYDFHASRLLDGQTSLSLFNGIASALLDEKGNLTIECESPDEVDQERLVSLFTSAWEMKSGLVWKDKADAGEVLRTADPEKKMKMKPSRTDPMSGGSIVELSNGLKVICRKMPADRKIYYSLALNGGYGSIKGLSKGEGAFAEDFINTCRVSGLPMTDFRKALAEVGVSMDFDVDISGMYIKGSASGDDLLTVIQALSALTGRIEKDDAAVDYLVRSIPLHVESMKDTYEARLAAIDEIMCPDYIYSDFRSAGAVSPDFGLKMWNYLTERFSRLDDGVLIITGDVDEMELRRILAIYGQEFKTSQRPMSRTYVRFQPISGVSTYTVEGRLNTVDLLMSARYPFTSENYSACMIASLALKQKLMDVFEDTGWGVEVRQDFTINPDERFNVLVTLEDNGRPLSLSPLEAMSELNEAVSSIASEGVDEACLVSYKDYLKNRMGIMMKDPSFWVEMISSRHLYGKDILTGFEVRCDAVTPSMVRDVLSALDTSGKVEYLTEKNKQ